MKHRRLHGIDAALATRRLVACTLLAAAAYGGAARAENPSPLPEWEYSAGVALMPRFIDQVPTWDVTLGGSVEVLPKYDGSQNYHVLGGPMFDIRYKDRAFLATGEGLGINFTQTKNYRAGFALTYDLGRSRQLSHELSRLNDVEPSPEAKLFGELVLFPVVLRVDVRKSVGGYNGWAGDFSAYMPIAGSKRFFVFLGPSLTVVDSHYMQHYFGITPAESQSAGVPVFMTSGGIKSLSFGANATWMMGHHWFMNLVAATDCLLNDADRSPTTRDKVQAITGFTIAYRF